MAVVAKKKSLRKEHVDEVIKADDKWEPVGHTPMPEPVGKNTVKYKRSSIQSAEKGKTRKEEELDYAKS